MPQQVPDKDIEKLCRGRIIVAPFYSSDGKSYSGPHPAVMIDTDEDIRKQTNSSNPEYSVLVISTKQYDKFLFPVPAYTFLKGDVQCSFFQIVRLADIMEVKNARILPAEMKMILELNRRSCQS